MQLQTVESSMIHAVGYDEEAQTLEVVFNTGKTYQYFEVPSDTYEGLMESDSKGSYMRNYVIDCYPYRQLRRKRR
jgi:uncharacterized protein CbrC (UPF0167 family)